MLNDALAERLPADWIIGQQIGVLAYALTQFDPANLQPGLRGLRQVCVGRFFDKLSAFSEYDLHPTTLPASTLKILAQQELLDGLPSDRRQLFAKNWQFYDDVATGRWDVKEESPRPSQVNGAKLVAHQILYSDSRPRAIVEALVAFLSEKFRGLLASPAEMDRLESTISTLREATSSTGHLEDSVEALCRSLTRHSQAGLLVRNALLDHLLAWPILIFQGTQATTIGAVSLPVAVDLKFDGQDRVDFRSTAMRNAGENLALGDWMGHLRHSAETGKALWRAKNGNKGPWRDQVMTASVTYDFTIAECIMGGASLRANFSDRSMEAYFAQIVLAKAIGRHSGLAAAVSGSIGAQRVWLKPSAAAAPAPSADESLPIGELVAEPEMPPTVEDEYVLDWEFQWPKGIVDKKKFVYESFKYDRFVLPPLYKEYESDHGKHDIYIETNHCKYLSDVADCVQNGGWRQFRYIRAPDVSHSLHKYSAELPKVDAPEVVRCISALVSSTDPVLRLPRGLTARHFFAALHHINFVRRLADEAPAPSLNWTVVRTIPEETDERLWHLLFRRAFGASSAEFDQVRFSVTPERAAALIARAMNRQIPEERNRGEAAPDLLILLGCKKLESNEEDEDLLAIIRPLSFPGVINALESQAIHPIRDTRLRGLVGAARIILIEEDERVGAPSTNIAELDRDDQEIMARLGTFRFGFTQQMAAIALHHMIPDPLFLRSKLQTLLHRDVLTYGGGWYCLRSQPGAVFTPTRTDRQAATDHFFAGLAFAPYLLNRPVPGLNIGEALLPDQVREAEYHLELAAEHANRRLQQVDDEGSLYNIRSKARLGQQRIMRFFDTTSWGQIWKLSRNRVGMPRRETYELAQEFLEQWRTAGEKPPSSALTIVARAGIQWWREIRSSPAAKAGAADALFAEIVGLFESAHADVGHAEQYAREQLLNVNTHHASFLRRFAKTGDLMERRRELDCEILSALADGVRGVGLAGEWFELYADGLENHAEASNFYGFGVRDVPNYFANRVKFIGAALLSGRNKDDLRRELKACDSTYLTKLVGWAGAQKNPKNINPLKQKWAMHRWGAGSGFLSNNFSGPQIAGLRRGLPRTAA